MIAEAGILFDLFEPFGNTQGTSHPRKIRRPRIWQYLLFLMLLPLFMDCSKVFAADNQITLVTLKSQENPEGIFLNLVYTEAFKRLGMTFNYEQYPSKRASMMSDLGKADGELSRIYSYNETHPNVIRVEEPHWQSGFLAVATDPFIKLDGWASLAKTAYKVTYKRGIKGCENNLPNVVRPENLERVETNAQGLKKLLSGWTDLFIASEIDIVSDLQSDEFRHSGLQIVGVMEKFTSHAFLHKKHKELAPKLAAVLKRMKQEGLVEGYWNAAQLMTYSKNKQDWMDDED
jgi:hypothetical protein